MAERFTETGNITPQSVSTGFAQGSNSLLNRLNEFQQSVERLSGVVQAKQGEEQAQQDIAEGKEFKRKEAGFFERFLTGGISVDSYNKTMENAYLSSLGRDTREAIAGIEAENADNITQFNEKAQGYINGMLAEVDPILRNKAAEFAQDQISNARIRVHRNTIRKNKQIATSNIMAGIESASIDAARLSRDGNQDGSKKAILQSHAMIDGLVSSGDMMPDEAAIRKREIEREATEQGRRKFFDDTIKSKGIDAAQAELDKIKGKAPKGWTPDEWQTYTTSQQADINRQRSRERAAAQEVNREAQIALKQYKQSVSLGFEVAPDEKVRVKNLVGGTDMQASFDRINRTAAFAVLPQDARVAQLNAAETGQLKDVEDYAAMLNANAEINKMAIQDGYTLGVKQGLIESVEFNAANPATLIAKVEQAEMLSDHYGVSVSPLTDPEANALSIRISEMTVAEKVQLATTLNEAPSLWGQISEKNQQAFAMAGATGDKVLMATVFQGQDALKEGLVKAAKPSDYLSVSDEYLADVYGNQDKAAILEAAKAHYAATTGNVDVFDEDAWEESLEAVTGGIDEVNGNSIELPRGVDVDDFEDFIDNFSAAQIEASGGVAGYTNEQAANAIQNGKIKSVGSNEYIIMTDETQALFKPDGTPFTISFSTEQVALQQAESAAKRKTRQQRRGG